VLFPNAGFHEFSFLTTFFASFCDPLLIRLKTVICIVRRSVIFFPLLGLMWQIRQISEKQVFIRRLSFLTCDLNYVFFHAS